MCSIRWPAHFLHLAMSCMPCPSIRGTNECRCLMKPPSHMHVLARNATCLRRPIQNTHEAALNALSRVGAHRMSRCVFDKSSVAKSHVRILSVVPDLSTLVQLEQQSHIRSTAKVNRHRAIVCSSCLDLPMLGPGLLRMTFLPRLPESCLRVRRILGLRHLYASSGPGPLDTRKFRRSFTPA